MTAADKTIFWLSAAIAVAATLLIFAIRVLWELNGVPGLASGFLRGWIRIGFA